jgi:hypothetical protein
MYKVTDKSGNIIPGLLKNNLGSFVVEQNTEYSNYLQMKAQFQKINTLTNEVEELKKLVGDLINNQKKVKT